MCVCVCVCVCACNGTSGHAGAIIIVFSPLLRGFNCISNVGRSILARGKNVFSREIVLCNSLGDGVAISDVTLFTLVALCCPLLHNTYTHVLLGIFSSRNNVTPTISTRTRLRYNTGHLRRVDLVELVGFDLMRGNPR